MADMLVYALYISPVAFGSLPFRIAPYVRVVLFILNIRYCLADFNFSFYFVMNILFQIIHLNLYLKFLQSLLCAASNLDFLVIICTIQDWRIIERDKGRIGRIHYVFDRYYLIC